MPIIHIRSVYPLALTILAAFTFFGFNCAQAQNSAVPAIDSPKPASQNIPRVTPQAIIDSQQQWQFANRYYQSDQWSQALAEFERFIFFFPEDPRVPLAYYRMGMARMGQNQMALAMEQFQTVLTQALTTPELTFKALFQVGACLADLQSPQEAAGHLTRVAGMTDDPAIQGEAFYRAGWLLLDQGEFADAQTFFERIPAEQQTRLGVAPLLTALADQQAIALKNPKIAGALALVPGAGYLYLQRYRDAWISLVLTGGVAWAAYEAFDNDSPVLGSLLGITSGGFYMGSIYGSVNSAHKANRRSTQRFIDNLRQNYQVRLSLSPAQDRYGLLLTGRF